MCICSRQGESASLYTGLQFASKNDNQKLNIYLQDLNLYSTKNKRVKCKKLQCASLSKIMCMPALNIILCKSEYCLNLFFRSFSFGHPFSVTKYVIKFFLDNLTYGEMIKNRKIYKFSKYQLPYSQSLFLKSISDGTEKKCQLK